MKFVVKTHNNYNQTTVSRPYFHMAKFDLFKLTSIVEVKSAYKNLGITDKEATVAYDYMAYAQHLCNNLGTAEELKTIYDALKASYDALCEKISKLPEAGKFYTIKNEFFELLVTCTVD